MEFAEINVARLFGLRGSSGIVRVSPGLLQRDRDARNIVDRMGLASQKAQGLGAPVTTSSCLTIAAEYNSPHVQRLYLLIRDMRFVVGLLKFGRKKLFVQLGEGSLNKIHGGYDINKRGLWEAVDAYCVLDFYVHESRQRQGEGRTLFDHALSLESVVNPAQLAYDRPSRKLLGFLSKHFGLRQYTPQANNFVLFDDFFLDHSCADTTSSLKNRLDAQRSTSTSSLKRATKQPSSFAAPSCVEFDVVEARHGDHTQVLAQRYMDVDLQEMLAQKTKAACAAHSPSSPSRTSAISRPHGKGPQGGSTTRSKKKFQKTTVEVDGAGGGGGGISVSDIPDEFQRLLAYSDHGKSSSSSQGGDEGRGQESKSVSASSAFVRSATTSRRLQYATSNTTYGAGFGGGFEALMREFPTQRFSRTMAQSFRRTRPIL
ncbi:unnamed protein product [Amoebophrya sp. A25]|nr:unnamed protein product [Amoebophrya sp. A25]|eukprot:GSA25T00026226001.1